MTDPLTNNDIDMNHFNVLYPGLQNENNNVQSTQILDIVSLISKVKVTPNDFPIIHCNISSLLPKYEEYGAFCFTETWLNANTVDLVEFEGYKKFDLFRSERRGGGISVLVDKIYRSKCLVSLCL